MLLHPDSVQATDSASSAPASALSEDQLANLNQVYSSGLCDLQINGFAGIDFNDPELTRALARAVPVNHYVPLRLYPQLTELLKQTTNVQNHVEPSTSNPKRSLTIEIAN